LEKIHDFVGGESNMDLPISKMITFGILPSRLKIWLYRRNGAKIGKGVSIGLGSIIVSPEIEIGDDSSIGPLTFINVRKFTVGQRVKIGSLNVIKTGRVAIDDDTKIAEQVIIGGMETPHSSITIGKRCEIFQFAFLNPAYPITIEDEVGIGGSSYIFTHGIWQPVIEGFPMQHGPVTLRKGVWLPWRVFILPNVEIGEYATIGAASVVTKNIPPRSLAVGSPAKVIKTGDEYIHPKSFDEKHTFMLKVVSEFGEWLTYNNYTVATTPVEDGLMLVASWKREGIFQSKVDRWRVLYKKTISTSESAANADIVISLAPLPDEVAQKIRQSKLNWFDIGRNICSKPMNPVSTEFKDYMGRYGTYFEIV
jgi:acetyltransferase-like isoleucine patch superfamily enzyme